jgi:hypothetical protein
MEGFVTEGASHGKFNGDKELAQFLGSCDDVTGFFG